MWTLLRRLSYLLRGRRHEADLREELEIHRQFRQAHLEREGLASDDAREASRRAIGNTVLAKEDVREVWLGSWDTWLQDVRYGTRALATNPGYALVVLLTLALCIGANTAVFSVVNAVVLRPLPYADPDRLVMIWTDDVRRGLHEEVTSLPTIEDWRGLNQSFTEMAILSPNPLVLSDGATAERTKGAFVSANVFRVLGTQPLVGRLFTAEEEAELIDRVVISHRLWQRHFGGNPNVIGRTLTVDGDANAAKQGPRIVEIVGVMPPDFFFPDKTTDLWEPATMYWRWSRESSARDLRRWAVVARLRSGVDIERAEADLWAIGDRLEREYAAADPNGPGFVANVVALSDQLTGVSVKRTLWTLLAAVAVLLLIGCTNIANLTLARGASRQAEFAVRRALGASRPRMARQLFIESLLLALVGGALGLLAARVTLDTLVSLSPASLLRIEEVTIDSRVLVYALLSSFLAAVLFGVLPALRTADTSPLGLIKESGTAFTSVAGRRSRAGLIALECALAVMLLTAATLLVKSLERLNAVPTGFRVADVVVARIALPTESSGAGGTAVAVFTNRQERFRQFAEQLAAMPNVQRVGVVDNLLIPGAADDRITVPGVSQSAISGQLKASSATPGFFTTLDVQLKAGRLLTSEDLTRKIALFQPDAPLAQLPPEPAVVNETFARRYFTGRGALGQRFCLGCPGKPYWYEVVGIVSDMRRQSLERAPVAEYFTLLFGSQTADLLIRTQDTPERYGPAIRAAVHGIDPGARVLEISTVDQKLGTLSAERRFQTLLLSGMAALAMMLAVGGVYGLARYGVVQRTREIGVRVALGARPESVVRLVVLEGVRAPLIGLAAGLAGAAATTRVMTHALFQISPTDPATLMQAALGMAAVILAACYLPARWAARIDPLTALRQ